jgi:SAM-dependent methyltransferase
VHPWLRSLADVLRLPARVAPAFREINRKLEETRDETRELRREVRAVRSELEGRLRQYHLQLGRLAKLAATGIDEPARLSGRTVPVSPEGPERLEWDVIGGEDAAPDPQGLEWRRLDACSVCGHAEFTVVNEWNKFLLLPKAPDPASVRYDYAVCHACGVLFATRRPFGGRYRQLLVHFGETTGKRGGGAEIPNSLLNPYPLSPEEKDQLRQLAAHGAFVSDHLKLKSQEYIGGLFRDRVENSIHLDVIASLAPPAKGARVLEVRSRAGTILEGLRRLFGADVYAMPIWESQQFLLQEVYGIPSSDLIDFDHFDIPFAGQFDLIVCNHMVTHVVRPMEFFAVLRRRLRPGGHLYLHNEPDDTEFLKGNQSMIATLNPLHLQAFDQPSLTRALAANGFQVVFIKARGDLKHMCLARFDGDVPWSPMTTRERTKRVSAYQRARDSAILRLERELRPRVVSVWDETVARGVASGVVEFDEKGELRLVRSQ